MAVDRSAQCTALAWHCIERGAYQEALEAAHELLASDPESFDGHYLVGHAAIGLGDTETATHAVQALMGRWPDVGHVYVLAGYLAYKEKNLFGAEHCFREARRIDPEEPSFYACLAVLLGEKGRVEEGITVGWKGLAIDPNDLPLLKALQRLYR